MTRRRMLTLLATGAVTGVLAIAGAPLAAAHPLGNFTHNTFVGFAVSPERIEADHVLDLAEVPTFQERGVMDRDSDGTVSAAEAATWASDRCATAATGITATTEAGAVAWVVGRSEVTFPAGQGDLPTTRLECTLAAAIPATVTTFDARVTVEDGRVGWHEIIATGAGVRLSSDVPYTSASSRLTAYPVGATPPDATSVHLSWTAGSSAAASGGETAAEPTALATPTGDAESTTTPLGLDGAASAFTDLVSRQDVTLGFVIVALAIAMALGAGHALAPGHGKTLMAASLIGTGGRKRDAVILGATVTGAHTAGVLGLALALSISTALAPEQAYPWLGLISALLAVGVGVSLLRQARRGHDHGHSHAHDHGHGHGHGHGHPHPHPHPRGDGPAHPHPHPHEAGHVAVTTAVLADADVAPQPSTPPRPTTRRVVALGLAGGLVPSPSAVVVLLAGFAIGRSWFALLLVVTFGLGMAVTLCVTGLLVVRVGAVSRRLASGASVPRGVTALFDRLPTIASASVIIAGLWIGVRSVLAL